MIFNIGTSNSGGEVKNEKRYEPIDGYKYMGTAPGGSLETDPVWEITKMLVNNDGSVITVSATNVKWVDKLTIIYN